MTVSGSKNVGGGIRSFEAMKSAKVAKPLNVTKAGTDGVSRSGRKDRGTVSAGEKRGFFSSMFGRKRLDEKRQAHESASAAHKTPEPEAVDALQRQPEPQTSKKSEYDLRQQLVQLEPRFTQAVKARDKAQAKYVGLAKSKDVTGKETSDALAELAAAKKESSKVHGKATELEEKRMVALGKLKGYEFASTAMQLDLNSMQKLKRGLEHLSKAGDFGQEISFYAIRGRDEVKDIFALFPGIDLSLVRPMYVKDVAVKSEQMLQGIVEGMLQAIDEAPTETAANGTRTIATQLAKVLSPALRDQLKALGGLSMLPVPAPRDGLLFE